MIKLSILILFFTLSCGPKKNVNVFDKNMLVRTSEETEIIQSEILNIKKECLTHKQEIIQTLENLTKNGG